MDKLGYEVVPIFFRTPFFEPTNAIKAAKEIGFKLIVHDITSKHLEMLKNPRYGFGKYMNPCIDCHGLMFREAVNLMKKYNIDFLISGEVVGQRPMSQRRDALNSVAKLSSMKDLIIRPLSQKLLPDTLPIRKGWVKKEEMLDISGRGRYRQMQLAEEFGIKKYQNPGGGCLLTDKSFSERLSDLMKFNMLNTHFIDFLKTGRHFRISPSIKLIVGRNKMENDILSRLVLNEITLRISEIPGPFGVINSTSQPKKEEIKLAGSILLRYANKADDVMLVRYGKITHWEKSILCPKMEASQTEKYLI
jgi:tRNA U34 2-thiouridine synthase MnmA/TrmU